METYRAAGHRVELLEPIPGLPDMVYAANGALVVDGRVLPARFAYAEREPEAAVHAAWHRQNGILYGGEDIATPVAVNEAEGDFAVLSGRILAGHGFRTDRAAHDEVAALTGREVISLELVDPHLYHLDVALGRARRRAGPFGLLPAGLQSREPPDAGRAASRTRFSPPSATRTPSA